MRYVNCLLVAVIALGCARSETRDPSEGPPPAAPEPAANAVPAASAVDSGQAVNVATPSPTRPDVFKAPPPAAPRTASAYARALHAYLEARARARARLDDDLHKAMELKVGQLRRFRRMSVKAYSERQYARFTSDGDQLTPDGKLALSLILDVESHGLEPSPYPLDGLRKAKRGLEDARMVEKTLRAKVADGSEALASLVVLLDKFVVKPTETAEVTRARLERALLGAELSDDEPFQKQVAELEAYERSVRTARRPILEELQRIDIGLLQGFFQYALDFKHLTVAHPFRAIRANDRPKAIQLNRKALVEELTAAGEQLGKAMQAMWPAHPYYEKTRKAWLRYRQYAKDGSVPGWKVRRTLKKSKKAKKGKNGKDVVLLKKRLAAEGYYEGDLEEPVFGDDLHEAVVTYQKHHQLKPDGIVRNRGRVDGLTRSSLNVPMRSRARQLRLALQRWRESRVYEDPFYFRVNVPQFEVEVWEKDELLRTHRIIVGNNKFEVDQWNGRKGHLNRTALISNAIKMVVLNPVWHVPERIRVHEIEVAAEKDPDYFAKHNYKRRELSNGKMLVYQEAGPGNALGRVKLLFPNRHSIYMHDTPKKKLFKRTVRAYSHGCMRLEKPREMAAFLLKRQGLMSAPEVERVIATKKERGIKLKEPVPIHIEYNTIAFRAGSDRPVFLNDVYKYDREYYAGKVPLQRETKIPIVREDPRSDEDEEADDETPPEPEKPAGPPAPPQKPPASGN